MTGPAGPLRVAVDFGTSSTCTALSIGRGTPQVVAVDGAPVVASAVHAAADGTLFVGPEAERHAALDPARYEPHPKRRVDEGELLLGATVVPVVEAVRAVLARGVAEARRVAGGRAVDQLVLTHPVAWGGVRTRVLRAAGAPLAAEVALVAEPVAAALFHVATAPPGSPVAGGAAALGVLDLGGGTADAAVVRRSADPGFLVLAACGDPGTGGADVDEALLAHVGRQVADRDPERWRALVEGRELTDRRRRRVLLADVRGAKETLSRHAFTDVPLPPPFPDVHVTRDDLERLARPALERAVGLLVAALADARAAGGPPVGAVFLVGGSSRIPLVARLVQERTGLLPTTLDAPETVVARGALGVPGPAAAVPPVGAAPAPGSAAPAPATAPAPAAGAVPLLPSARRAGNAPPWSVPTPPRRRPGRALLAAASTLALLAGTVALALALRPDGATGPAAPPSVVAEGPVTVEVPDGWRRVTAAVGQVRLEPLEPVEPAGPPGPERVLVEQYQLDYDAEAEPARAAAELRTQVDAAEPGRFDAYESASYAGRPVIHYRERPTDGSTVEWYVVFRGRVQVNVACQSPEPVTERVARACEEVVGSLDVVG